MRTLAVEGANWTIASNLRFRSLLANRVHISGSRYWKPAINHPTVDIKWLGVKYKPVFRAHRRSIVQCWAKKNTILHDRRKSRVKNIQPLITPLRTRLTIASCLLDSCWNNQNSWGIRVWWTDCLGGSLWAWSLWGSDLDQVTCLDHGCWSSDYLINA